MNFTPPPLEYKDTLGNFVTTGDFVAYAVSRRKSGALNVGIITELGTTKTYGWDGQNRVEYPGPTVKLRLYEPQGEVDEKYRPTGVIIKRIRNATTSNLGEMVKITTVPEDVADFLRSGKKEDRPPAKSMGDIDSALDDI